MLRVAYARTLKRRSTRICCSRAPPESAGWRRTCSARIRCPSSRASATSSIPAFSRPSAGILLIDADYFWKYTHNAYDFSTLLNTTITFPIAWHNSKLDGVTGRVSTTNLHGFQAYWTFGHTRARYFSAGGWRADPAGRAAGRRRVPHRSRPGVSVDRESSATSTRTPSGSRFTWRYDSGLVVSGVPDAGAALAPDAAISRYPSAWPATVCSPRSATRPSRSVRSGHGHVEADHAAARRYGSRRTTTTIPTA